VPSIAPDVHSSYHPNELNLGMFLANFFLELRKGEVRRILLERSSENPQNANFVITEFSEVRPQEQPPSI
jgi:hypothetical protein